MIDEWKDFFLAYNMKHMYNLKTNVFTSTSMNQKISEVLPMKKFHISMSSQNCDWYRYGYDSPVSKFLKDGKKKKSSLG